jgi:hypothetical protein
MDRKSARRGFFVVATLVGITGVASLYLASRLEEIPESFPVRWRGERDIPVAFAEKGFVTVFGGLCLAALAVVLMEVLLAAVHGWSRKQGAASSARDAFEVVARRSSGRWTTYLEILVVALATMLAFSPLSKKAAAIWHLQILLFILGAMLPIFPLMWRLSRSAPPVQDQPGVNRWLVYWAPTDPRLAAPGVSARQAVNLGNVWNVVVLGFPMLAGLACILGHALRGPSTVALSGPASKASEPEYPSDVPLVWPATVTRKSGNKDRDGRYHPPWTSATVWAVLPRPVKVGDAMTVLPLKAGLPARQLKVTAVREQPAVEELPATWMVDIDASEPAFFNARPDKGRGDDTPFDVVVVDPPVAKARLLSRSAMASQVLPKAAGSSIKTLWAAVDLQSDGEADVAIFRFCFNDPSRAQELPVSEECERGSETIYLRRPGRAWRLVHEDIDD